MRRPTVLLAHYAGIELFSAADLRRLDAIAEVLDQDPLGGWDDPRADDLLAQAEVVLGHWGCPPVDAAMLARAPRLGLIAYAAGTVKGVVTPSVFERGIRVTSGSAANAEPVAEFTLAAIILSGKDALWRRDALRDPQIRSARRPAEVPVGNWGRSIGLVGASAVGRRVIELLRPFPQLHVAVHDPYLSAPEAAALGVTRLDLDELCASSDVLSIHAPSLPETHHLIGAAQLAALRTGATVINTARGSLVDHQALRRELEDGRLYAVLDVTDPEPLGDDDPLRQLPNVFLTPHLAGSEGTELGRLAEHAIDEIDRWRRGAPAGNEVAAPMLPRLA